MAVRFWLSGVVVVVTAVQEQEHLGCVDSAGIARIWVLPIRVFSVCVEPGDRSTGWTLM